MNLPLLAALCVLALAAPAAAAKAATRPAASLSAIVETTLRKGKDWTLTNPRAAHLGYSSPSPARKFVAGKIADGAELSSIVTLAADAKSPRDLIFSITRADYADTRPVAVDGYSFRADLTGALVGAARSRGRLPDVVIEKLDPAEPAIKAEFDRTIAIFLALPAYRVKR